MLLSSSIVLIPDWTTFVQLAIFLSAMVILTTGVLRPFARIRDLRKAATVDAEADAAQLQQQTDERLAEYRQRIEAARQEGAAVKEQLRQEGYAKASELMDQARTTAIRQLDTAKAKMQEETEVGRRLLAANADEFARAIAERLLERSVVKELQRPSDASENYGRQMP